MKLCRSLDLMLMTHIYLCWVKPKQPRLTVIGSNSSGRFGVHEDVIPQRGLGKVYQQARLPYLPGADYPTYRSQRTKSREGIPLVDADAPDSDNEKLVEMQDVHVKYGDKEVLGDWEQELGGQKRTGLSWTIRRGERWGVFGPNGMGQEAHKDLRIELTRDRIWKNNTYFFDLL